MIGIYKIENLINHKIYIGQSKDIHRRWKQHIAASKDVKHALYFNPFYRDMRSYGVENFSFTVCETIEKYDKKILDSLELSYMKKYDTLVNGYNIQASMKQKIALENIDTNEVKMFSSFASLEDWLHRNHITTGQHLKPFLNRAIKNKNIIYQHYKIYFWKE